MVPNLVSIITPCYGTAKYLPNLLQSILIQTYPHIEIFVIDDGSPDDIKSIVTKFKQSYAEKGYNLQYVWQPNSGQSVAIQNGLNRIQGEYLVWPDSDDFYASEETIARMVERFRQSGSDVGMVRTLGTIVDDTPNHNPLRILGKNCIVESCDSLFEDCMLQQNGFYYCPGDYMLRTDALRYSTALPIYTEKDAGQNWQLMLPVLYHYKCSTIPEPLYNIVERTTSHSRTRKSYEQTKQRLETYRKTIIGTLRRINNMPANELERNCKMVDIKYIRIHLLNALYNVDREDARYYFQELKQTGAVIDKSIVLKYLLLKLRLLGIAYKISHLVRKK